MFSEFGPQSSTIPLPDGETEVHRGTLTAKTVLFLFVSLLDFETGAHYVHLAALEYTL